MTEKTFRQPNDGETIKQITRKTPLFSGKSDSDFEKIYERCEERQYDKRAIIAHSKKKREGILLITSGLAEVYASGYRNEREVLELVGPGEIVGLGSLSTMLQPSEEQTNTVEIQALETTLGLFIPYAVLQEIWEVKEVQSYFLEKVIFRLKEVYQSLTEQLQQSGWMENQKQVFKRVQDMMSAPLLTLPDTCSIQDGIQFMAQNRLSAAVCLDASNTPVVISMRDVIKAMADNKPLSDALVTLADHPGTVLHRSDYYYDALSLFQQHPDLRHIVVVDDQEMPVGMLTLSDVLKQRHRSIQQVMKQIDLLSEGTAEEISDQLKRVSDQLIEDRESVRLLMATMTPLFDQVVTNVINLAQQLLFEENGQRAPCEFAFYQMGSGGRGEQLSITDQDHFLVYKESSNLSKVYFEDLSNKIVDLLEALGFTRCDGDMMASNPLWRGSVEEWQPRIRRFATRSTPQNILYSYNFFAMRLVYGPNSLHQSFIGGIQEELKWSGVLLVQMGKELRNTLIPSLDHRIRSFIMRDGKEIDLKKRVLFPFHHTLQLKGLQHQIVEGSTNDRLDRLHEQNQITDMMEEVKESLDFILSINLQQKQKDGTSRVIIDDISSREKALLSRALTVLREFQLIVLRELGV
ncbi:CBS domain-containing protein [Jeotgalibacillus sp. S-D1]|uniref:DUF294 nucleotidyltransferase-like domain-containing protein n=1 Tax=Jeotgalibacillus sp. S-D1 TaxID=2552189 RepID=UPI001059F416|nr:DUF294 nucleotidyltransferase-like domain-containing protein [Jeotgalibacillus sp. S-D1]TDL33059.1 CBS domain-containing protein [Jeotgalibacillus sp. S-D1]